MARAQNVEDVRVRRAFALRCARFFSLRRDTISSAENIKGLEYRGLRMSRALNVEGP